MVPLGRPRGVPAGRRLGDGDLPELRYEIVTVKLPFLYGLCKRDFIQWVERDNDQLPMEYWEEYLTVTAAPWGAEEVFQRYSGAEPVNQFLLCWPGPDGRGQAALDCA